MAPGLCQLSLSEHVPIVVRTEAGKAAISGHALKVAMQPRILLIVWVQLHTVSGCNRIPVLDAWRADLRLSGSRDDCGDKKCKQRCLTHRLPPGHQTEFQSDVVSTPRNSRTVELIHVCDRFDRKTAP